MHSFVKYFIHFSFICFVITLLIGLLCLFELTVSIHIVITYLVGILFFSGSMALIFSNFIAKQEVMDISMNIESHKEVLIKEIIEIGTSKWHKKAIIIDESHIQLIGISNYAQWLTNPINIEILNSNVSISAPVGYRNTIKKVSDKYRNQEGF